MSTKNFDDQLRRRILEDFDEGKGQELLAIYEHTKSMLKKDVYPQMAAKEPNLTDHGIEHVMDVQKNAIRLLSDDGIVQDLSGIEMYCIGMLILFHDVGIVLGRENHHNKVAEVFDEIRGNNGSVFHEKTLIVKATRAHTGTAQDGSNDTLKEVAEFDHLEGNGYSYASWQPFFALPMNWPKVLNALHNLCGRKSFTVKSPKNSMITRPARIS